MKCTDFENRIELLFDDNTPAEVRREMLEHLETCPACAEFYRQTKAAFNAVAPRVEVQAPAGLKARILKTAAQAENTPATARTTAPARPRRLWLRPLSATLSAAALIALVLLVFDPVGRYRAHAAGRIFRDAAAQLDKSRSFRLEMNVRTLPQENFSYIDAEVPFVPHRMWVEPGSGRWRLEKAGRIALSDGERILMWSPEINSGFIMRPGSGAIEDFATLLDPYTLLLREELNFAERRNASYSKQVGPETITLTVEAPAEGDFSNDNLDRRIRHPTRIPLRSDDRTAYRAENRADRRQNTRNHRRIATHRLRHTAVRHPLSGLRRHRMDRPHQTGRRRTLRSHCTGRGGPQALRRHADVGYGNTRRRTRLLSARPYEGTICRLPPPRNTAGLPFGTVRGSIRSLPSENVRWPHRKNNARSAQ